MPKMYTINVSPSLSYRDLEDLLEDLARGSVPREKEIIRLFQGLLDTGSGLTLKPGDPKYHWDH